MGQIKILTIADEMRMKGSKAAVRVNLDTEFKGISSCIVLNPGLIQFHEVVNLLTRVTYV